jgi:hypothetical protein
MKKRKVIRKKRLPLYKTGGDVPPKGGGLGAMLGDPMTGAIMSVADLGGKLLAGNKAGSTKLSGVPVIGGFSDALFGEDLAKKQKQEDDRRLLASMKTQSQSIIDGNNDTEDGSMYNTKGVYRANRYKYGGAIPLSGNSQAIQGASHEQGGVPLDTDMDGQYDIEAEGGETLEQMPNGGMSVGSDSVINPKTGNTFADDLKVLGIKEGKVQKQLSKSEKANPNRFNDGTIGRYEQRLGQLEQVREGLVKDQDEVTDAMGVTQGDEMQEQGMPLAKYGMTNITDPTDPIDPPDDVVKAFGSDWATQAKGVDLIDNNKYKTFDENGQTYGYYVEQGKEGQQQPTSQYMPSSKWDKFVIDYAAANNNEVPSGYVGEGRRGEKQFENFKYIDSTKGSKEIVRLNPATPPIIPITNPTPETEITTEEPLKEDPLEEEEETEEKTETDPVTGESYVIKVPKMRENIGIAGVGLMAQMAALKKEEFDTSYEPYIKLDRYNDNYQQAMINRDIGSATGLTQVTNTSQNTGNATLGSIIGAGANARSQARDGVQRTNVGVNNQEVGMNQNVTTRNVERKNQASLLRAQRDASYNRALRDNIGQLSQVIQADRTSKNARDMDMMAMETTAALMGKDITFEQGEGGKSLGDTINDGLNKIGGFINKGKERKEAEFERTQELKQFGRKLSNSSTSKMYEDMSAQSNSKLSREEEAAKDLGINIDNRTDREKDEMTQYEKSVKFPYAIKDKDGKITGYKLDKGMGLNQRPDPRDTQEPYPDKISQQGLTSKLNPLTPTMEEQMKEIKRKVMNGIPLTKEEKRTEVNSEKEPREEKEPRTKVRLEKEEREKRIKVNSEEKQSNTIPTQTKPVNNTEYGLSKDYKFGQGSKNTETGKIDWEVEYYNETYDNPTIEIMIKHYKNDSNNQQNIKRLKALEILKEIRSKNKKEESNTIPTNKLSESDKALLEKDKDNYKLGSITKQQLKKREKDIIDRSNNEPSVQLDRTVQTNTEQGKSLADVKLESANSTSDNYTNELASPFDKNTYSNIQTKLSNTSDPVQKEKLNKIAEEYKNKEMYDAEVDILLSNISYTDTSNSTGYISTLVDELLQKKPKIKNYPYLIKRLERLKNLKNVHIDEGLNTENDYKEAKKRYNAEISEIRKLK